MLGEEQTFRAHFLSALASKATGSRPESPEHKTDPQPAQLERLWYLASSITPQIVALARTKILQGENPIPLFKAIQFQN